MQRLTDGQIRCKTQEGYSFVAYGLSGWMGAIRVLRSKGLNDEQIEVFLLSKHMRWAGDCDEKRRYGHYNGNTVKEYLVREKDVVGLVNDMINGIY